MFWHSSAHILGAALETLYQGHLGHGPALDNGFFYDVYINPDSIHKMDNEQLPIIQKAMQDFVLKNKDEKFERLMVSK